MSFEFQPIDEKRAFYEPNGSKVIEVPRGNLIAAFSLLINAEVDILTSDCSNAPDHQISRMIKEIRIVRNSRDVVWSLSGEMLAALYTNRKFPMTGNAAADNSTIAGTVANNVKGQHFLFCPLFPWDALKPWDFAMDTRKHKYEIHIKFRDLQAAGTLFGSIGGSIGVTESENFVDLELMQLDLRPNPANGQPDSLTGITPLMMGLQETITEVNSDNSSFSVDVPEFNDFRNLVFWTTHELNTDQVVGENDIFDGNLEIKDTQKHTYQNRQANTVRQDTSQRWGVGSGLSDGVYDLYMTAYGAVTDAIVSNNVTKLLTRMSVKKQSNATNVHSAFITQEEQ